MAPKTCFDYIISSLSPDITTKVRGLLLKPPEEQPYDTLKTQLIKRTAASKDRKLGRPSVVKNLATATVKLYAAAPR